MGDVRLTSIDKPKPLGYNSCVVTIHARGVRFRVYPQDHGRRHVHGLYGGVAVIVELRQDGTVALADRKDSIRPGDAKRSDVRWVLEVAAEHFEPLAAAWEKMHR